MYVTHLLTFAEAYKQTRQFLLPRSEIKQPGTARGTLWLQSRHWAERAALETGRPHSGSRCVGRFQDFATRPPTPPVRLIYGRRASQHSRETEKLALRLALAMLALQNVDS